MTAHEHDIAVIGLACRFPGGAGDPESFWRLLAEGRDAVTEIDDERWDKRRYHHTRRGTPGRSVTFAAGVVPGYKYFDAEFFGLSPKEAASLDPQQRLALELTWEALENAGLKPSGLAGREVGVYIGAASQDASLSRVDDVGLMDEFSMLGLNLSLVSNRISHKFDFRGPSLTLDTACSSSLVALHEACLALTSGGLPLALAGGIHSLTNPMSFIGFSRAGMLAEDGRCRPFDEGGQGYVRAEGGGLFLLKPYKKALADGDRVWARIKATAVNANGRTASPALPDQRAQKELLTEIYGRPRRLARLAYLEAHGTGTAVGDPIEALAIGGALPPDKRQPLWLGSVKGNLGHLETASGAAGLMKAVLTLRHGLIPPSLHFNRPNPEIDFQALKLKVPTTLQPLPDLGGPALAGVNSFGFGGVNAHVLIEAGPERPEPAGPEPARPEQTRRAARAPKELFLPLTAKSRTSLAALAGAYADFLDARPDRPAAEVAAAVLARREPLPHRVIISGDSREELTANLRLAAADEALVRPQTVFGEALAATGTAGNGRPLTVFMFSGNGGLWPEMGRDLLGYDRAFTETVEKIDTLVKPLWGWSILNRLRQPFSPAELSLQIHALPLLFALQAGLFKALAAKGLKPDLVMGHSFGELAAAWAAGILKLEEAIAHIRHRALIQERTRGLGSLAAVGVSAEKASRWIAEHGLDLQISAVNAPKSVTLTGAAEALDQVRALAKKERRLFVRLNVEYPFHSRRLNGLKKEFLSQAPALVPGPGRLPFVSTVTGRLKPGRGLNLNYWWRNMAQPVLFQPALETALNLGARFFLEIGPSKVLDLYVRETSSFHAVSTAALSTLHRDEKTTERLEMSWKTAWARGWPLDWSQQFPDRPPLFDLPLYPWNREYHWKDPSPECGRLTYGSSDHPLLGRRRPGAEWLWENQLDTAIEPWLADHKVAGRILFPAAAMAEMALKATSLALGAPRPEVENLRLIQSLELGESLRVLETRLDEKAQTFRLVSRRFMAREPWITHAEGRVRAFSGVQPPNQARLAVAPEVFGEAVDGALLYKITALSRIEYGPAFQAVDRLWINEAGEILARFQGPGEDPTCLLPPRLLDAAFQALFLSLSLAGFTGLYLPHWLGRVSFLGGRPAFALASIKRASPEAVRADFELFDEEGVVVAQVQDCRLIRAELASASAPGLLRMNFEPAELSRLALVDLAGTAPAIRRELTAELKRATPVSREARALLSLTLAAAVREFEAAPRTKGEIFQEMTDPAYEGRQAYLAFLGDFASRHGPSPEPLPFATLWRTFISEYPEAVTEARLAALAAEGFRRFSGPSDELSRIAKTARSLLFSSLRPVPDFYMALGRALAQVISRLPERAVLKVLVLDNLWSGDNLWESVGPFLAGRPVEMRVIESGEANGDQGRTQVDGAARWRFETEELERLSARGPAADVVVAPWILSGQADPGKTLGHLQSLLNPGGLLLAPELGPADFFDLILGLEPWWWDLSPDPGEPVSRLRTAEEWRDILGRGGLAGPEVWSGPDDLCLLSGQAGPETARAGSADGKPEASWLAVTEAAPSISARRWLEGLKDHCRRTGRPELRIMTAPPGENENPTAGPAAWARLFQENAPEGRLNLLFAFGLETEPAEAGADVVGEERLVAASALVQGWDRAGRPPLKLWLLCGGALPTEVFPALPSQAALWGYGRTLMNELPGLDIRLVDIHDPAPGLLTAWADQVAEGSTDREAVLAGGRIWLPRLEVQPFPLTAVPDGGNIPFPWRVGLEPDQAPVGLRPDQKKNALRATLATWRENLASEVRPWRPAAGISDRPPAASGDIYRLEISGPQRRIDNLRWVRQALPEPPGPGQVQVAVEAVGLNFRDVMWASGLLPEEALADGFFGPHLGLEGAGHILATGPGVSRVAAGDRVMFFASQSFATRLTTPETAVMRLPDGLPGRQAAGLPVAFGTVWYALAHLARMRPGETLLVHGAAGGVGLAALEISRRLGLTVLATAGSEERRGFLKMMGAAEVFDSRCLSFSDQVLAATGGRGVDAVLNSIAGEAVARSLGCLASFGRFLELGKRDFYQDSSLGLYPFRRNLSYFGIDVDQLMSFDPALAAALAGELEQMFRRAEVGALPCTVMPFEQTRVAFNHLRESRPIGKMVVDLTGLEAAEVPVRPGPRAKPKKTAPGPWGLKKDASYLVTGASGGFGLATARHLFEQGAGHLFLLGRRAAEGELADLLAAGAGKAELVRVDLADGPALTESLTWALAGKPPLRGVIHAAAVYDDAQALKLSPERLRPVMAGKARGAWNLHQFTKDRELDFFILYSSLAALIGNPGQANYVAANMVLENLAVYRRSLGLPALAVRWGAIRDAGLLTRRPELLSTLEKLMGERAMTVKEALNLLPVFLENGEAVATLARSKWRGTRMLPVLSQPLFAGLNPASASEANEVGLADLINGQTPEKAVKEIVKFVTGRLADILRLPVRRISPEAPFSSFGMDSLMMAELLSGLEEAAGGALNLGSLSQDESLHSLAEKLYLDLARPDLAGSGMAAEEREFLESMARRHGIELPAA